MWPTFYIPASGSIPEFIDPDVAHVCGTWSYSNTGVRTIPTPTGAELGDTQLIVINYQSASAAGFPDPLPDGNPWWLVSRHTGYYDYAGAGWQYILWRQYDPADGDFTFDNGVGATKGCYTSILLKNQNDSDPFFNAVHLPRTGSAQNGPWDHGAFTGLEAVESGDLAVYASMPSASPRTDTVGPPDAEFLCNLYSSAGSTPHVSSLVSGTAVYKSRQHNLLKNSTDFSTSGAWTATRCTITNPAAGTYHIEPANIADNGTSTTHYIEQDVELEAGKSYLLALQTIEYTFQYFAVDARLWLTITDPNGNEAGFQCSETYALALISTNDTSLLPNDNVSRGAFMKQPLTSNRTTSAFGMYLRSLAVGGTYKVRIYVSSGDVDPTVAGSNPFGSCTLVAATLMECPAYHFQPSFIETGATAVLPGEQRGIVMSLPRATTTGDVTESTGCTIPIIRRNGGPRPVCRLFAPLMKTVGFDITDNTVDSLLLRHTGGAWYDQTGGLAQYIGISSTHSVSGFLPQKKFYYEMKPTAFGTDGAIDQYSIGFAPPTAVQHKWSNTKPHATVAGRFSYCADGKIFEDGVNTATVTAWSVNDNIGASIDFTNAEIKFYRNGTAVHTASLVGNAFRYGVWCINCGINGATASDEAATFEWNFKGSFSGRKPSGFYAWDFDNEVA